MWRQGTLSLLLPAAVLGAVGCGSSPAPEDHCAGPVFIGGGGRTPMDLGAPSFIAAGDFNDDGRPDIVAVRSNSPNLTLSFSKGDGTFRSLGKYGVGSSPTSIVTGDFNGDRALDVAVVNSDSNDVSVLLRNGNGIFAEARNYPLGPATGIIGRTSIATGDFNGDGRLDLAAVNGGTVGDSVSVLLGDAGGFGAAASYHVGRTPASVATGDFDGDGALDLAVVNRGADVSQILDNVAVLRGNGDGSFAPAVSYAAGGDFADSVVVADFDGDQKLDLAVSSDLKVGVLAGNGDGTFRSAILFPLSNGASGEHFLTGGDFDGDGHPDLAAVDRDISVLRGRGDGTFDDEVRYAGDAFEPALAIGDFDNDAKLDLVCGDSAGIRLLRGLGDGAFDAAMTFGVAPVGTAADFNGDGVVDLVELYSNPDDTRTLVGHGDGTFTVPPTRPYAIPFRAYFGLPVVAGDLDGDGALDIALVNSDVRPQFGRGDGTFDPVAIVPVLDDRKFFISLVQGDFNGDGVPDLATGKPFPGEGAGLLLGDGARGFRPAIQYGPGGEYATAADFNRDGRLDVATLSLTGAGADISLGNGDGSFLPAMTAPTAVVAGTAIVHGDFNRDGRLDVAIAGDAGGAVLLGKGDGRLQGAIPFPLNREYISALATADFDGDGRLDLVATTSDGTRVLFGAGDGSFTASDSYLAGPAPFAVYAADFNGDGRPDVGVVNNGGGTTVLLNGCQPR